MFSGILQAYLRFLFSRGKQCYRFFVSRRWRLLCCLSVGSHGKDSVSYMTKKHHRVFCSYCCQLKAKANLKCLRGRILFIVKTQTSVHEMPKRIARVGIIPRGGEESESPSLGCIPFSVTQFLGLIYKLHFIA